MTSAVTLHSLQPAGWHRIVWAPPGDAQTDPFTLLLDGDLPWRTFPELLTRVEGASDPTEVSS